MAKGRSGGGSMLGGLGASATTILVLAAITLTALAVISGFKNTGLVDNTTAGNFETGLATFGTFVTVLILMIIGKAVISGFRGAK